MESKKLTKELIDSVRHIDGFPIGSDEDIIELSDAPYYTACPNPFINDFIDKYGTEYNEEDDNYHREPFASDVSEGKSNPIYNAHSYHTKVPHKAIMRYILHYTNPGDIVFDGFSGTGMTGVAAYMCGNPENSFKYQVDNELDGVKWGKRRAILSDLSTIGSFIGYNYSKKIDLAKLQELANLVLNNVEKECGWVYKTIHKIDGKEQYGIDNNLIYGNINYTVFSEVFSCPECSHEIIFTDVALDKETGKACKEFECPNCSLVLDKKKLNPVFNVEYDEKLNDTVNMSKFVPIMINYSVDKKNYNKELDEFDIEMYRKIDSIDISTWYPTDRMIEGSESRRNDKRGITHVHQYYTKKNLYVISYLNSLISGSTREEKALKLLLTSQLINLSKLNRYRPNVSFPYNPLSGTLYISSMVSEANVLTAYKNKLKKFIQAFNPNESEVLITNQSTSKLSIPDNSIDYIFTDPPFGENLMYSELSFIWESWIKVKTNNSREAVVNKKLNKDIFDYKELLEQCFSEMYRILKPGRWITVEFSNTKSSVWNAIQEAIMKAGFIVADVRTLDKQQGSFKQVTTNTAMKQDLIISAYKPKKSFINEFSISSGNEENVWKFVEQHLRNLPIVVVQNNTIEKISERQHYMLNDRMISFHIQNGISIPMDADKFYRGLNERFIERDGMYFLPEQVEKYDRVRSKYDQIEQLSFIVTDEKSAIQWIRTKLDKESKTYQELQPEYLKELHQVKYEKLPELINMLEENFLKGENGKWYVPDINKQSDLDKIRERSLLKEFEEYKICDKKLKQCRLEAIRFGFKKCWKEKDYTTIVNIAKKLQSSIIEDDPTLLMYYDNAMMIIGE